MANRYWRLREERNRKQNIQDEKAYDREINSIYEQAFDEIQDEINSFYGKYARKEGISMAEAKKRVSRLDIEAYERKAARYVAEKNFSDKANEEMRLYNTTMKINRLEMLKSDIALRLTGAADRADKYSGKVLTEATRKELERQAGILGSTVHSWNTQAAEKIVKSPFRNATYSERVWNNASTIQYDLEKELRRTLIQGKAMDFSRLGPFAKCKERAKADARRLLKTELVRCRSEAQKAEYEENGFDEYEFMCLGANPCEICQGLNGKHFPVRDLAKNMGEFAPPIHPNCRCTTAPWVDEGAYNGWLNSGAAKNGVDFVDFKELYSEGPGDVTFDNGYNMKSKRNANDIEQAYWLANTFGGNVRVLQRSFSQQTPDYEWNEKYWDLKTPQSTNGSDKLVHHGLHQIEKKPGGILVDCSDSKADTKKVIEIVKARLKRSGKSKDIRIIIKEGVEVVCILK